ncbi:DNA alkylation repair enzyme [Geomicrobium sp. JCM 19037]|uniref:DNA alkylation repair protein n=1 Tax=Geomicrobium sp. JCM 19037 TaxID=1460634 RepID=UPI00045F44C2|nr:DNA alkylation repair protein [Geomicrobium sp. JCM 19037]GAK05857.1 DNA alkylation repair enzyme [Geomicrobium sp. JCM 19037]
MAEPLKDMYDHEFIKSFAQRVSTVDADFHPEAFLADIFITEWNDYSLLTRMRHIARVLGEHLSGTFEEACDTLARIDDTCEGGRYLFFPEFIAIYGMDDWALSMRMLERWTKLSTAEFAVRPFILKDPEYMLVQMYKWAQDQDEHVRRLASEGTRPRLPWGKSLPMFIEDPASTNQILETLKADPSLYVRRSVANHLNDISKDHPKYVLRVAAAWQGEHKDTDWVIRHACRTLLRRSVPEAFELFGYSDRRLAQNAYIRVEPAEVAIGEYVTVHYGFEATAEAKLRVEYAIDFVKARGKTSQKKVFINRLDDSRRYWS